MIKLHKEKRIIQTREGIVPKEKRYLDEMPGIILQDVWDDIYSEHLINKRFEYPTQKPLKLLERIIELSTNPKDLVLDPFCGSGTTLCAARNLNRNFIGIDINRYACIISRKKLKQASSRRIGRMAKAIDPQLSWIAT